MGKGRFDYYGYGDRWLTLSDLKPGVLKQYGIIATQKQINAAKHDAHDGFITTGGQYNGHHYSKHVKTYSISRLKEALNK